MKKIVVSTPDFFEFSETAVATTSLTETPSGSLLTVEELVMEKEVVEDKEFAPLPTTKKKKKSEQ
jgi:hypothetical protein